MKAEIIAVGPFRKEIIPFLEYPEERYAKMKTGTMITSRVIQVNTTAKSRLLAECLQIDTWDFSQHELDVTKMDYPRFAKEFDGEIIEKLRVLRGAGFSLFFRPND